VKARLTVISFGLAAVAAVFLMVWPVHSGFDGRRRRTRHCSNLMKHRSSFRSCPDGDCILARIYLLNRWWPGTLWQVLSGRFLTNVPRVRRIGLS
jgi:hypothetical protein